MLPPPSVLTCWVPVEESSLLGARLLRKHEGGVALKKAFVMMCGEALGDSSKAS